MINKTLQTHNKKDKMSELYKKFVAINDELNTILFEREEFIEGISLAILAKTNILTLGPAGTAKSYAVEQWTKRIKDANFFDILINRFTTPEEILGPVSFDGLRNDRHVRVTDQMLPTAHLAFLDEIFKASSGILNALLRLANERTFKNGPDKIKVPLYTMIGASNEIPDEEDNLDAFYDRFLLKYHVNYIQEDSVFAQMLYTEENPLVQNIITQDDITLAQNEVTRITLPKDLLVKLVDLSRHLKSQGIIASDRTYKKAIPILKAKAWMSGHNEIIDEDLEILKHIIWKDPDDRKKAEKFVLEFINPEKHKMIEIWDACVLIAEDLDKRSSENEKERGSRSIEVLTKINSGRETIKKLEQDMRRSGRDTKDALLYLGKLAKLHTKISMIATGMTWMFEQTPQMDLNDFDPKTSIR
jgi:MoxR-like ATPase